MVSMTKIVSMAVCILLSITAMAIPLFMLKKRSSKIETGLSGAVAYGFLGYVWQSVLSVFLVVLVNWIPIFGSGGFRTFAVNFLGMLCGVACTALSLFWGIYLTNQKQRSLYRSAAVGIGFSLGKTTVEYIALYARDIYYSIQINNGTYQASDDTRLSIKQSILERSTATVFTGMYKCLVMFVIIFAITLIMGNFYLQNENKKAWISVICLYGGVILINIILRQIFDSDIKTAYDVSYIVVYTVLAGGAGIILYHWFRHGIVELNPLAVIRSMKEGRRP